MHKKKKLNTNHSLCLNALLKIGNLPRPGRSWREVMAVLKRNNVDYCFPPGNKP